MIQKWLCQVCNPTVEYLCQKLRDFKIQPKEKNVSKLGFAINHLISKIIVKILIRTNLHLLVSAEK